MTDLPIITIEAVYKIADHFSRQYIFQLLGQITISPMKADSSMQFLLYALLTIAESQIKRERERE